MPPEKNRERSMYDASKMALLSKFPKKIKQIFLEEKNPVDKLKRLSKEGKLDDISQSFVDFLHHPFFKNDPLLIEEQIKLWDLWKKGGGPFLKVAGESGRASYEMSDAPKYRRIGDTHILQVLEQDDDTSLPSDTLNIYENTLLNDYMAEISHGIQYARKEGESVKDWQDRRRELGRLSAREHLMFGEKKYGRGVGLGTGLLGRKLELHGIPFPREFPTRDWESYANEWEMLDPLTGRGKKGSDPTHEFKAHSIIEPSLWRQYRGIRKSIFGGN